MRQFTIFLFYILISITALQAQSVKDLEAQRKATLKQLETSSKILNETKKSQKSTLNKLNILTKSINERKKLIQNIGVEISALDQEMQQLQSEKTRLEKNLTELKADYVRMVREAHINRSIYAKIMFVLSADNFDQSYRRLRYLQEYSDYRKRQVIKIENTKQQIVQKTNSLAENKQTKTEVASQKEKEAQKLSQDQKKEKVVLTDLKRKEKKLNAEIQAQKKKANEINNKIERIIAEEIRKAEEKRRAEERKAAREEEVRIARENKSTKSTSSGTGTKTTKVAPRTTPAYTMTKEETALSGNFSGNQGRLPWPVDKGFISGRFGVQSHPVLKYVTTNNKGIYIQTPARSNARAVFEGIVTQRFSVPGSNNGVIIKHGQYRTVYANLTDIYVSVGQKVSTKQSIGRIYTDSDNDNKTELYFQIWRDRSILNPEGWISK
jgi:septal ring factor EnvC (AmiA/AmiB activator)